MLILIFSTVISAISFATNKFGDLQSTIAAIIFDREARSVVLDFDSAQGSLIEPLLELIAFMRAMNYQVLDRYQSSVVSSRGKGMDGEERRCGGEGGGG